MHKLHVLPLLPSWLLLTFATASTTVAAAAVTPNAKSGCPTRCGDLVVPYPFGIGLNGSCSFGFWHNIRCDTSFNPPKAFYGVTTIEVVGISETQLRIKNNIGRRCYKGGVLASAENRQIINLAFTPFAFSYTANKFTIIGCDDFAILNGTGSQDLTYTGCVAACTGPEHVLSGNGSCSGIGCCQTTVPKGLNYFVTKMGTVLGHRGVSEFNPCGYAFMGDKDKLTFNVTDLSDPTFQDRTNNNVPIVIDWFVGKYQTCRQAQQNLTDYACQQNSNCTDSGLTSAGYRCSCLRGYEGNPYLPPGCTDIDECASRHRNPSAKICTNTPGSYICTCPKGHKGDGLKKGTGCTVNSRIVLWFSLGMSLGFLLLVMSASWIYITIGRKKLKKKREIFFKQNGGLLLKEQLPENDKATTKSSKIFSEEELRIATKHYRKSRVLGEGGFGRVYKGILKDGRQVAIKKAIVNLDKGNKTHRINEFINEVVTLFQVNHQNVVKLLGCCLETEVPLLVYEFISNGTLRKHTGKNGGTSSWLDWNNTVRVATEAASGLAHLHSTPIIHGDVKSDNILLDDQNTAKIADFGASRQKAFVQNNIIGTRGYIGPEYIYTNKITEKSDVYSFGIVLAELLTKEKAAFSNERYMGEECATYLGGYFLIAVKANRVMDILDSQLVDKASRRQLLSMADLVSRCLNPQGENRPTMSQVARELERMQDTNLHPWADPNYQETTSLIFHSEPGRHYPVPSNNSVYNEPSLPAHEPRYKSI